MRKTHELFAVMALSLFIAACGRHAVTMSTADSVPSDSVDVSDKAAAESMNAEEVPLARRSPDATVRAIRGSAFCITTQGLRLSASAQSVKHSATYTLTALAAAELPPRPQGMVNMTASAAGYRLLPSGEHFSPAAELRVAYNPDSLPPGYTPDDIYTSYYDTAAMAWVRLERVGVDTASHEIVSLTTHFTDFINELLKAPEMPETQAFVPTMMSDLEAVNPVEGLPLFQPPTANQEGTANLSFPIWIPAGRGGMQPNLALSYSSGGGNGWLGVGWDLSVPAVTLDTRWGVPRYSSDKETEIYLLAGEQLVNKNPDGSMIPLPHRSNQQQSRLPDGTRFYARTGDAHDSIVRHGDSPADYWWEVTDRGGTTHYYGHYPTEVSNASNPSTLADERGNIARWMLCESRDPNGNWVRYFYDIETTAGSNPGVQIYLDSISYTGHTGFSGVHSNEDGVYSVLFRLMERSESDRPVSFINGFKEEITKKLCNIQVMSGDTLVMCYRFNTECGDSSNYKTRLRTLTRLDGLKTGKNLSGIDICTEDPTKYFTAAATTSFDYHDAPMPDNMFGPETSVDCEDDNIHAFFVRNVVSDQVTSSTALGMSHNSGWSAGGTLAVGLGSDVSKTTYSMGGNFQYAKNHSEALVSLVDIDGDGLADKVFKKRDTVFWRRQYLDAEGGIHFSDKARVQGVSHFLLESTIEKTPGLQGSAGIQGSGSWTESTSETSTYMADVDGDGLVDIVDGGRVLFNRTSEGEALFVPYTEPTDEEEEGDGGQDVQTPSCNGIIFDGDVSDSIGCTYFWTHVEYSGPMSYDNAVAHCQGHYGDSTIIVEIVEDGNGQYLVDHLVRRLDCSGRNLSDCGLPGTEAVRVWVAPRSDTVILRTFVSLSCDTTRSRLISRNADGVTFTVQQSKRIDEYEGTLQSDVDSVLFSKRLEADYCDPLSWGDIDYRANDTLDRRCTLYVQLGDILYFRLRSNTDRRFDNVYTDIKINYKGEADNTYDSGTDFVLCDDRYFRAPYSGSFITDGTYTAADSTSLTVVRPDGAAQGSGPLSWSGNINEGDEIRVVTTSTGSDPQWSQVNCRMRIRLYGGLSDDTLTVWLAGERRILHAEGSVWAKPSYQRLFGKLYRGWGQFAYRPLSDGDSIIRLSCMSGSAIPSVSDTASLRAGINAETPASDFDCDSPDSFTESHSGFYNPLDPASCWVDMSADAEHGRWVAFGLHSSINADTMSNSIQTTWYSSATNGNTDIPPQEYYDDAVPQQTDERPVKGVLKVSRSRSHSTSFGVAGSGWFNSRGENTVAVDYMDLNGDRYPDIVGPSFVQYRSQWGGMGNLCVRPDNICNVSTSTFSSDGTNFGASPVEQERTISFKTSGGKFTLKGDGSLSASFSSGHDNTSSTWLDINGDGLPDYVYDDGTVVLNKGYSFTDVEDWGFDSVQSGQSLSGNFGIDLGLAPDKTNISQGSIQLGWSLNRSVNRLNRAFVDINGDGLPDILWRTALEGNITEWGRVISPDDSVHVCFNQGGGRWSPRFTLNISDINCSDSYNESLNAGATIGVPLFGAFKFTGGVNGTPLCGSVSRDRVQLVDVNGDGMPDLVSSVSEGEMTVRYHRGAKANLLKKVTNFTGSSIHLGYTLSEPDCSLPSRSWLLTQVTTKDPLNPNGADTTVTRFEYSSPHYDRLERTSYGFGVVTTYQVDPSGNTVYRSVRRDFHNENILVKGRPKREMTSDGQGHRYVEKEYQYDYAAYDGGAVDTCSGNAYSLRDRIVTRFYEGSTASKMTIAEAYEYDRYHNVVLYVDEGDTAYADDGLYVAINYQSGRPHNLIGLRDSFKVYSTGSTGSNWMRRSSFVYDSLGRQVKHTLYDSASLSVYNFSYDAYGNLDTAITPQNDSLQRMAYICTYDSYTHTYPVKIKNSVRDSVLTSYLLPFGKPTRVTDPGGSVMRYDYDFIGRLVSVTSPLNGSTTPSLVNEYYPINYYISEQTLTYGFSSRPYAVTAHYDDQGNLITRTVVITDGFGRVVQTKKGITAGNQQKMQVSGREFTDVFGRVTGRHDVFCENISTSPGSYNPLLSTIMDTILYDVLDRDTEVRQPLMNYTTRKQYDVQNDALNRRRFTTAVTDPNGHTTVLYTDYDGRQVQVTDALGGTTTMTYDALGQLLSSTDPEDFSTTYSYDRRGRLTGRTHPDAGTTHFTYDAAGNLTKETTPLGMIFYDYTYQRLAKKRYSDIVENNVTYTYGTNGTGRGRPVRIEDGTGVRQLAYDALGNVTSETRTIAIPGTDSIYTFITKYTYDSWGRMQKMIYPDGEVILYTYGFGGDLNSVYGYKGTASYDYVTNVTYNNFGQRRSIDYGNGTRTIYTYDCLHRLSLLKSVSPYGTMQQIQYIQDGVSNISKAYNTASSIGTLGGTYYNNYQYDALNRLTGSDETNIGYAVAMEYSASGRIARKTADSYATYPVHIDALYGYCDNHHPHAPKRIYENKGQTLTELIWDEAGNLGQVNTASQTVCIDSRFLFWTEDNRLHTVTDSRWHSYYAYDYAGERTLKLTGKSSLLDVNADLMLTSCTLDKVTLYPSPYVVLTDQGYTKHYYAGSDRICARIGGGGLPEISQNDTLSEKAASLYSSCLIQVAGRTLESDDVGCVHLLDQDIAVPIEQTIDKTPKQLSAKLAINMASFCHTMAHYANHSDPEPDVYFYHSDHLGSASWITDAIGKPVQHLQYLPFGEQYIDQHITGSSYRERFTFTGKEKDSETGFYYFGARYYDPTLSGLFLSVDPMADKYPSLSPYAYCSWNPVKLVDPDGRDWYDLFNDGTLVRNDNKSKEYQNSDVIWSVSNKSMSDEFSLGTLREQKRDEKNGVKGSYISLHGSREENVAVFEFCSDNSNVEFSLMEIASSEDASYTILTTSHNERKVGVPSTDNYGTEFAKSEFYNLISHLHNHIGQASPSGDNNSGDISFRNKIDRLRELSGQTTRVLWGIYKCRGKEKYTKDYDGNTIDPITMRPF